MMRALFVDDEPNILAGIRRALRGRIELDTAGSAAEALEMLRRNGAYAVVVSDMRMPGTGGADLLAQVRKSYPDTVRIILSGQADLESMITAVNQGQIFRFLTKPCSSDDLLAACEAGFSQHRLQTIERDLLEQTLQRLVETLTDILGLANPLARQRTIRIRQYAAAISTAIGFSMPWELRLGCLLSQLGCITLPAEILDKIQSGESLTAEERARYSQHPRLAARLISKIPRLESVAAMIARQQEVLDCGQLPADVRLWDPETLSTLVLSIASGLDERLTAGDQPAAALKALETAMPGLPRFIVEAVRAVHLHSAYMDIQMVRFSDLTPGMVVDEDVVGANGRPVMFRGEEITASLLDQLRDPATSLPQQKVRVLVPA